MGRGGAKGVSAEEKRRRALEYMHEKKEVFTLSELEKQLHKHKGIVSQSVKDVLAILVDDGLVDVDKIGSGNFFWALPSKALCVREKKVTALKASLASITAKKVELEKERTRLQATRQESDDRAQRLREVVELRLQVETCKAELAKYASSDPERIKELESGTTIAKDAADRWTDNIQELMSFYKKKLPHLQDSDIYKNFGLPLDLDYLDV